MATQLSLFPDAVKKSRAATSSTFADSLSLPVHRWFRYSAGFSAIWARDLIERERAKGRTTVLDPMCGSGTVLLEAELCGVKGAGVEAHPFVARVAQTKLLWRESPRAFRRYAHQLLESAKRKRGAVPEYPRLVAKCFPKDILEHLHRLRVSWESCADGSAFSELTWLALMSILRACSPVGTAQWQYVLPKKRKAKVLHPYEAFEATVETMCCDMLQRQSYPIGPRAQLYAEDARECGSVADGWADLVVTSPPYANNYDYADATRLEMTFLGEIRGWGDLQGAVRQYLVRACTQHVAKEVSATEQILGDPRLEPIRDGLATTCRKLAVEREHHGGRKAYHTMVAAYFSDMARVWRALRRVTGSGSLVCFVIGDSAPYGVYVPVDRWLGELAVAVGFDSFSFEKTRDRNVKWKNRKHRVPLHEGRLWVKG